MWQSLGDIGAIGNSCPLIPGGAFGIRAVEAFGTDICIGGDFTNLGGITGLSYFACYSDSLGWYQPNGIGNGPNNSVYSIDVNGTSMFLGGVFTFVNAGTLSAKRVVKTDGLTWEPLYTDANQTDNGLNTSVNTVFSTTSFLVALTGLDTWTWNPSVPEWVSRGSHNGNTTSSRDVVIFGSTLTVNTPGATMVGADSAGSISDFNIGAEEWSEFGMSQGVSTNTHQLAYGLGPLYATGDFTAFDANAQGLAWYNGVSWQAAPNHEQLGNLNLTQVNDLQQGGNEFCLQTGGSPIAATRYWVNHVCYNGSQWVGDNRAPLSNVIQTIGSFQGNVIHGGDFTIAGDVYSAFVAQLDNSFTWQDISQLTWSGGGAGSVSNLATYDGHLYASGIFNAANGTAVNGIAKYDGINWSAVSAGLNGFDALMTVWNNELIIDSGSGLVSWDGNASTPIANPPTGTYTDMTTYQGDLVVATLSSGTSRLHRYDGNSWQTFAGTLQGVIKTLAANGNDLYVGGDFSGACNTVDFVPAENIFLWDGFGCDDLGGGVDNSGPVVGVNDMAIQGDRLYITGRFETAGGMPANSLAMWYNGNWTPLQQGLLDGLDEGTGNALFIADDVLYVAGYFEQAGDVLSHHFAAIDVDAVFSNGFD